MDGETPEAMDLARRELSTAIEALPSGQKIAYLEAVSKCPELIETEANPMWFHRADRRKASSAALRMTTYWQRRVETFSEQAFMPLAQSLTECDKELLRNGSYTRLPDNKGRPVLLLDLDQVGCKDDYEASRKRLLFYWALEFGKSSSSQSDGVIVIQLVKEFRKAATFELKHFYLIEEALNFRVNSFIVCPIIPSPGDRRDFFRLVLPSMMKGTNRPRPKRFQLHPITAATEVLSKLTAFQPSGLPTSLGGTWSGTDESVGLVQGLSRDEATNERATKRLKQAGDGVESVNKAIEEAIPSLQQPSSGAAPPITVFSDLCQKPVAATAETGAVPVKVTAVLQALDSLRRAKRCSVVDLLRTPNVRSRVFGLLREKGRVHPVVTTTSAASGQSTSETSKLENMNPAADACPKSAGGSGGLSQPELMWKAQAKKRLLQSLITKAKQRSLRQSPSSAVRNALVSKVLQKLGTMGK